MDGPGGVSSRHGRYAHPLDAKFGVADGLAKGLEALASHFEANPETLDKVMALHERLNSVLDGQFLDAQMSMDNKRRVSLAKFRSGTG